MSSGTKITTQGVLYINGEQVENTFSNISKITRKLEGELKKLPIGTKEFIDKANEVKQARARFEEVKKEIASVNGALEKSPGLLGIFNRGLLKIGDTFKQVFTANVFERFLDVAISKGSQTVDELLKIADAMTDVEKTTGMTLDQVKDLWDSFDEMDTRTGKLERLKIAEIGGRLGVPVEQMKDFVQEIDKAYVALGDSFEGGLKGVVDQLGKIKGLFEDTKGMTYAEAVNRVGSALNTLAAQGTASEGNISQFALRVGALPDALKPAIDKVLGLGAAFEESGIDAQIASSGFSNFITTAAENIESFAYSMNMGVDEAKKLINTKPEEFFLRFAEGMKDIPADQTAKIFASLKLNSLEVQKAVGAAANRTDDFRKAMKTAGIEMENMNSLTDEFNKKNNNAPAIIEKIKNAIADTFTSTNALDLFEPIIQGIGWITGVTKEASDGVVVFKERLVFLAKVITVVTVSLISYRAAIWLVALATKSAWEQTLLYNAITRAQNLANQISLFFSLAKSVRSTADALALLNLVGKANVFIALATVIPTVVVAMKLFNSETKQSVVELNKQYTAIKANKTLQAEAAKEEARAMGDLKQKTELYIAILRDKNMSLDTRKKAYENLIAIYPQFKGTLDGEYLATDRLTTVYDKLVVKLQQVSKVRAYQAVLDKANEAAAEAEVKRIDAEMAAKQQAIDNKAINAKNAKISKDRRGDDAMAMAGGVGSGFLLEGFEKIKTGAWTNLQNAIATEKNAKNFAGSVLKSIDKDLAAAMMNAQQGDSKNSTPISQNRALLETPKNRPAKSPVNPKNNNQNDDLEKAKAEYTKALEANDKNNQELLDAKNKFIDEQYKVVQEGKQKEWDLELEDFKRKKDAIQLENDKKITANKKLQDEIDKLTRDADETKNPKAKSIFKSAIAEKEKQQKHNIQLINQNQKIEDQMLQTHGFNLLRIEEKWETIKYQKKVEELQAASDLERKSLEDMINNISTMEDAKQALQQMEFLKLTDQELAGIKTLEDAKKALRENADRAYLDSQIKLFEEQDKLLQKLLQDPSLSPEAVEKLKKNLEEIRLKITQVTAAKNGKSEEDQAKVVKEGRDAMSQVDILGFSATQWSDAFQNLDKTKGKLDLVKMGIQALGNAFSMFSDLQRNLNEREMASFNKGQEKKKKSLLKQLNEGYITQEEYHKGLQLLEEETDTKKKEIAVRQAKMQKIQAVAQIAINTASAIMSIWAQVPKFDFGISAGVLTGIVAALGAVQAGIVLSQPLPEFSSGGFGKEGFEGFTGSGFGMPDKSGHKKAVLSWLHEDEWVAPKWMRENPRTANVINWLESVRQGGKNNVHSFAEGGNVDNATSSVAIKPNNNQSDNYDAMVQYFAVMSQVKDLLQKLYDDGITAEMTDSETNGKLFKKAIKKFETIENRASGK